MMECHRCLAPREPNLIPSVTIEILEGDCTRILLSKRAFGPSQSTEDITCGGHAIVPSWHDMASRW